MFFSPGTAWGFDDEDIHKGENSLRVPEVDDQGLPITRHTTQLYYTTPPKSVSQIQFFSEFFLGKTYFGKDLKEDC